MKTPLSLALITSALLAACSSGSSDPEDMDMDLDPPMMDTDGAVRNGDGSVTVMAGDETFELPVNNITSNGQPRWFDGTVNASGFETDDVFAIGGIQDETFFSAVTGTFVDAPVGSLTYEGRYSVSSSLSEVVSSALTIEYDAAQSTLTALDGDFSIDGTVTAAGVATGTVTFEGSDADFNGGFFGADADVAGAFHNNSFAGIFYGDEITGP